MNKKSIKKTNRVWFDTNAYWIETNSVALEVYGWYVFVVYFRMRLTFCIANNALSLNKIKFIRINFVMGHIRLNWMKLLNVYYVCVSSFNRIFRWKLFELILELKSVLSLSLALYLSFSFHVLAKMIEYFSFHTLTITILLLLFFIYKNCVCAR